MTLFFTAEVGQSHTQNKKRDFVLTEEERKGNFSSSELARSRKHCLFLDP